MFDIMNCVKVTVPVHHDVRISVPVYVWEIVGSLVACQVPGKGFDSHASNTIRPNFQVRYRPELLITSRHRIRHNSLSQSA
jgi:hypothetical protein